MNKNNNPKKGAVDTTKKQNVSRYADRRNDAGKGGKLRDKTVVSVNHEVADKLFENMPNQVQLLIMNIDVITEQLDVCTMSSLNNRWIDEVMPEYDYSQDSFVVLNHYLTKFNGLGKLNSKGKKNPDTYKGYNKETLLKLFRFNAS
jgi:hypothetical protein|tara:strand:+ start:698 stop:1135 length:438 start_codon:yes stop_codon:yes gene_type:complete